MNPTTEPPQLPQPPPQPPQPHRPSTSCDRHPDEHFTGFCPSCLCERLAVLDPSSSSSASSSRKPPIIPTSSTATAALKAIFKPSSSANNNNNKHSFFPELRRTKSFSASKNEGFSGVFEPQRKSCDVRARNTLWSLFNQDDELKPELNRTRLGSEPNQLDQQQQQQFESESEESSINNSSNIKVVEEPSNFSARNSNAARPPIEEIIEEEEEDDHIVIEPSEGEEEDGEQVQQEVLNDDVPEELLKPMKDYIDLDSQAKKKDFAGSFWSAASVFSKKWQKWRQKQKEKKRGGGRGGRGNVAPGSGTLPVEKPIGRQYRETQSEIADYGFGRRSCDTDPRFSLDAGRMSFDAARMSFDDPRYSLDEPRASWDGYLIGKNLARMPTMLSVVEDAPVNVVSRSDAQIPVEESVPVMNCINEDESVPGGSAQTRDYYSDSSSRRRRSLDRSNSIRKTAAAVVAEIDEIKNVSNAKVSPATVDYFHGNGTKAVGPERDFRDSNSNSLRDDCSESFEMGFRDNPCVVVGNGERKGGAKKSRRWGWNILGFIHRRSVNKDEEDDRYSRVNGVERSFSESWQDLRGERNGDARGGYNPKVLRSNSSVSWRNSQSFGGVGGGAYGSARKSSVETNGYHGRKKKDEFVLERNRSARYSPSPNSFENGLLNFHLAPMRSSLRGGSGRPNYAQSVVRTVLRLS